MKEEGNIHIIGQGTYGCVYSPNIECETQKLGSKKFLSKWFPLCANKFLTSLYKLYLAIYLSESFFSTFVEVPKIVEMNLGSVFFSCLSKIS